MGISSPVPSTQPAVFEVRPQPVGSQATGQTIESVDEKSQSMTTSNAPSGPLQNVFNVAGLPLDVSVTVLVLFYAMCNSRVPWLNANLQSVLCRLAGEL